MRKQVKFSIYQSKSMPSTRCTTHTSSALAMTMEQFKTEPLMNVKFPHPNKPYKGHSDLHKYQTIRTG